MSMNCLRARFVKFFYGLLITLSFICLTASAAFSGEDLGGLIKQGDEALARGDFEQALLLSKRIVAVDPLSLKGYGFGLISCVSTMREREFSKIIEEAKKQGVPQLMLLKMSAEILYMGYQTNDAYRYLCAYEDRWREENEHFR